MTVAVTSSSTPSKSTDTNRPYDFIVWGATGFTGKLTCEYIAREYGLPSESCKYAIAARTSSRLDEVEKNMIDTAKLHNKTNGATSVPKMLVDVNDTASVDKMTKQAKCILAVAGPFVLCGEPIVKSCVENKTHYVDSTGETEWVVKMHKKYNEAAVANGVKVVPACGGLDYMPNEIAMVYIQNMCAQRNVKLRSVQYHTDISSAGISGGTIRSIIEMTKEKSMSEAGKLVLDPYVFCSQRPRQSTVEANRPNLLGIKYNPAAQKYAADSVYSQPISAYMRWSNESQNFPWGKDLVVDCASLTNTYLGAIRQILATWFMYMVAFVLSRFPTAQRFIPKSGDATFEGNATQKDKYYRAHCTVEAIDTDGTVKTFQCLFNAPYELYWMTAISMTEAAVTAAREKTPTATGVMGCSGALGKPYMDRLEKKNITVKFISINS